MLSIGGLFFRLQVSDRPRVNKAIDPFVVEMDGVCDIAIDYHIDESVSETEIHVSPKADRVTVRYNPEKACRFETLRGCLMHVPMEQILLAHDRFFLHASFIASPYGGLLFTGDSGVGKSTQAELWREHMDSTVINGDRAIVAKEKDCWRAYGSPYAGSSGYYIRRDEPVRAIILLEKSQENQVDTVSDSEAFRRLILQISLDYSRTGDVVRICDLVTEMISYVPVYRLRCTPDIRAVNALCDVLRKEGTDAGK